MKILIISNHYAFFGNLDYLEFMSSLCSGGDALVLVDRTYFKAFSYKNILVERNINFIECKFFRIPRIIKYLSNDIEPDIIYLEGSYSYLLKAILSSFQGKVKFRCFSAVTPYLFQSIYK